MWTLLGVKVVGIFEAKTTFAALCEKVVQTGLPILVKKRGVSAGSGDACSPGIRCAHKP